jgi:bifunctional non-homologous end joining protein LigD
MPTDSERRPDYYPPMLLRKTDQLPEGKEWSYEHKFDGFRAVGYVAMRGARLMSRKRNNMAREHPTVAQALHEAFDGQPVVVDGELVALDDAGHIDFNLLKTKNPNTALLLFDLLHDGRVPIIGQPLTARRERLRELYVSDQPQVQIADHFDGRDVTIASAVELGMEGVIAKRNDSIYRPGIRSRNWLKYVIKQHRGWRH